MFEKAEILFVCIVNTGLAWMAEGAMRAKLPQADLTRGHPEGGQVPMVLGHRELGQAGRHCLL